MKKLRYDIVNSFFIGHIIQDFKESFLYYLFSNLFGMIERLLNESLIFKKINKFFNILLKDLKTSYIYNFIKRVDINLDEAFKNSFLYLIFSFFFLFLQKIFLFFTKPFKLLKKICIYLVENPSLYFGIYFIFMCIIPHKYFNNFFVVIASFTALFIYLIGVDKNILKEELKKIHISFMFFIVMIFLGLMISFSIKLSIKQFLFDISAIIMCLLFVLNIKSYEQIMEFLYYVAFGICIVACYGILLQFTGIYINGNDKLVILGGIKIPRMFSTLDNPNNLAEFIILFIPFLFVGILNEKSNFSKAFFIFSFILGLYTLIMTYTRTAWIAFSISVFTFMIFYNFRLLPIFILFFLVIFEFLPKNMTSRLSTVINFTKDSSFMHRIRIWNVIEKLINDYGYTGIGLGNNVFVSEYSKYTDFTIAKAMHSHNLFLNIWVEMGIFGIISYLIFSLRNFFLIIKCVIVSKDKKIKNLNIAMISSSMGIFLMCLLEYVWFYPRIMIFFFIVIGIIMSAINISYKGGNKCQLE